MNKEFLNRYNRITQARRIRVSMMLVSIMFLLIFSFAPTISAETGLMTDDTLLFLYDSMKEDDLFSDWDQDAEFEYPTDWDFEDIPNDVVYQPPEEIEEEEPEPEVEPEPEPEPEKEKGPFRLKNRAFELGFANISAGVGNNFLGAREIFTDVLVIDFSNFDRGLNIGFNANIRPFFININVKDRWGFGFDIANITAYGNVDINSSLLQVKKADRDRFGVGAAVFADVGIPIFFHIKEFQIAERNINRFRVDFRPAAYLPLAYTRPQMAYTFKEHTGENGKIGALIEIEMLLKVHTPVSIEDPQNTKNMFDTFNSSAVGVDFSLGFEYPLFNWIDVGVNINNIPLRAAALNYYMEVNEKLTLDSSKIDLGNLINGDDNNNNTFDGALTMPDDFEMVYGTDIFRMRRPFKMVFYADYRPFDSYVLSLIPTLGFSVNSVFTQRTSVEAGIKARCDLVNMFITTIGTVYEDQMWKNSIDFVINLRLLEIGFGVSVQSQRFIKSYQAAGVGINFGLKMGW